MIVGFIMTFVFSLLSLLVSLFPVGPVLSSSITSSIVTVVDFGKIINSFFPVYTLWTVIGFGILIELANLLIYLILWIIKLWSQVKPF